MAVEIIGFSEDNTKVIVEKVDIVPEENLYYFNKTDSRLYQYVSDMYEEVTGIVEITAFSEDGTKVIINEEEIDPVDGTIYRKTDDNRFFKYTESVFDEIFYEEVDVISGTEAYNSNVEVDPIDGETYYNRTTGRSYTYEDGEFKYIAPRYTITEISSDFKYVTINGEQVAVENDSIYVYPAYGLTYVGVDGALVVTNFRPSIVDAYSVDIRNSKYDERVAYDFTEILGYEDTEDGLKLITDQDGEEVRIDPVDGTLYFDVNSNIYYKYENNELHETNDIEEIVTHDAIKGIKYVVDGEYDKAYVFILSVDRENNTFSYGGTDIPLSIFAEGIGEREIIVTVSENEHYRIEYYSPDDVRMDVYIIPYIDLPVDSVNPDNNTVVIDGEEVEAVEGSTYVDLDSITFLYEFGRFTIAFKEERVKEVPTSFDKVILEDNTEKAPVLGVRYITEFDTYVFVSNIRDNMEAFVKDIRLEDLGQFYYIDTSNGFVYSYDGNYFIRYTDYDDKFNIITHSYNAETKELTIMIPEKVSNWHVPAFGNNTDVSDKVTFGYDEFYQANTITVKEDMIPDDGNITVVNYI